MPKSKTRTNKSKHNKQSKDKDTFGEKDRKTTKNQKIEQTKIKIKAFCEVET
jgi:hypothetical protein